jgi:hypothetical protein
MNIDSKTSTKSVSEHDSIIAQLKYQLGDLSKQSNDINLKLQIAEQDYVDKTTSLIQRKKQDDEEQIKQLIKNYNNLSVKQSTILGLPKTKIMELTYISSVTNPGSFVLMPDDLFRHTVSYLDIYSMANVGMSYKNNAFECIFNVFFPFLKQFQDKSDYYKKAGVYVKQIQSKHTITKRHGNFSFEKAFNGNAELIYTSPHKGRCNILRDHKYVGNAYIVNTASKKDRNNTARGVMKLTFQNNEHEHGKGWYNRLVYVNNKLAIIYQFEWVHNKFKLRHCSFDRKRSNISNHTFTQNVVIHFKENKRTSMVMIGPERIQGCTFGSI